MARWGPHAGYALEPRQEPGGKCAPPGWPSETGLSKASRGPMVAARRVAEPPRCYDLQTAVSRHDLLPADGKKTANVPR